MKESVYQARLIKKLKTLFPDCIIMKNDSSYAPGIPDLTVLFKNKWAMLEIKASSKSKEQPNQKYYVEKLDELSFAAFIFPENEEEVLNELQHAFNYFR